MSFPSPGEIAQVARAALETSRDTPEEHFRRPIRCGFINFRGEVTPFRTEMRSPRSH